MKKLLLISGATAFTLFMAACADAPTNPAPAAKAHSARANYDLTCRSGYVIAYDENGDPYCAPDPDSFQGSSVPAPDRP